MQKWNWLFYVIRRAFQTFRDLGHMAGLGIKIKLHMHALKLLPSCVAVHCLAPLILLSNQTVLDLHEHRVFNCTGSHGASMSNYGNAVYNEFITKVTLDESYEMCRLLLVSKPGV